MKKIIGLFILVTIALSACKRDNPREGCMDPTANNHDTDASTECGGCCGYTPSIINQVNVTIDYTKTSPQASYEWYRIDLNGNSTNDVGFKSSDGSPFGDSVAIRYQAFQNNSISLLTSPAVGASTLKQYKEGEKINFDTEESTNTSYTTSSSVAHVYKNILTADPMEETSFARNQSYYIGLFVHDGEGNTTNGWIKIRTLSTDYQVVIESYGYNPTKNQTILAGK